MRGVVWLLVLFVVAVVAATALGQNDGLVTLAWSGWRLELSLNLALLLLLAFAVAGWIISRALEAVLTLPRRASQWRDLQRERAAHAALTESFSAYFGARYSRAQKAARRAMAIQQEFPGLPLGPEHRVLAQLVTAASLHRLQDRGGRDAMLAELQGQPPGGAARAAVEGASLLAAEWALDDQDAARAYEMLMRLPPGVARRTQALRLRLRAARLSGQSQEALEITRLLAKHQAFTPHAAQGLMRALAAEHLDAARDIEQLRRQWLQLEEEDRRDAQILFHAVQRAVGLGSAADARLWLDRVWPELARLSAEDRSLVMLALALAAEGAGAEWLERTEAALKTWPMDAAVLLAAGIVCAQRQLWGKARQHLQVAADRSQLPGAARREAWRTLARLARDEGDEARASACEQRAAGIDG